MKNEENLILLVLKEGIKNKQGELTWKDKNSANYYSVRYLWNG